MERVQSQKPYYARLEQNVSPVGMQTQCLRCDVCPKMQPTSSLSTGSSSSCAAFQRYTATCDCCGVGVGHRVGVVDQTCCAPSGMKNDMTAE